jgi:hypothetical protein
VGVTEEIILHEETQDLEFSGIDWGTIAPGTSADLKFRVYNTSPYYTATGVELTQPDTSNHYLSSDGENFVANLELPDIPPSLHSTTLTLRRVIPHTATAGVDGYSISITVGAWVPAVTS